MSENILVVEYEPRYTDRVRQALAGQPFVPAFARDGEEAIRALDDQAPKLIVLSSVVPKISTAELIRAIRGRKPLQDTPILLTVSGYTGKSPKLDAQRLGASDILPKPYSESEFLGKVQQMLGVRADVTGKTWAPELDPEFAVRTTSLSGISEGQLTSNEIFGDLLDDDRPATGAKKAMKPKDDLDKMLADTLAGVMPVSRKTKEQPLPPEALKPPTGPQRVQQPAPPAPPPAAPQPPPQPTAEARSKQQSADLDKLLNDTLSGLQPRPKPAPAAPPAAPKPQPAPAAAKPAAQPQKPANPAFTTEKMKPIVVDKMPISQPVIAKTEAQTDADEEPKDGVKFGQYVLLEKIATGGMAEVWKARMRGVEGFQKIVAIKKILPHLSDNQDFIEMFIDEAKLAAQLNHNNIIHIYDLGKIQSSYYIAMEYIDGYDLKTILRRGEERGQPMQVELALFIASKIASALDYAHRKHDFEGKEMGLVHRDVSPQNVLISQEGDIKLCDFGIAKAASKASHTQAGALKGKLQYMSPEQAWGRHIDKRSDIFALSTVLFEMLTGRKLFTGDNELSILEQVREARVATPSELNDEVTPEIDKIVQKALHKDPAGRYQTAGEMARDLDAVLYTFRPTPTSADLAIYMHRIWSPEPLAPSHEPEPLPAPAPVKAPAPAPVVAAPVPVAAPAPQPQAIATPSFAHEEPEKKAPIVPIAIAAAVVIAILIGWFVMKGKSAAPAAPAAANTPAAGTTAAPTAATPQTASVAPASTAAGTTQAPTLDQSKVDAEVAKRIAADRAKMEQQARTQPAPTATPAPAPQRPAPAQVATATQAPAPVPQQPAPQPVVQQPAPQPPPVVATQAPAPQPEAPAAAQVREGDLVPAGTAGLQPARMVRRGSVPYPPMAKLNRVEGVVVLSVLVNETGKVLEVRVLRPIARPVGLNEAAEEIVRRSTFSAPTKDGVKVKSWTTVPVEFKL